LIFVSSRSPFGTGIAKNSGEGHVDETMIQIFYFVTKFLKVIPSKETGNKENTERFWTKYGAGLHSFGFKDGFEMASPPAGWTQNPDR
jgi:hypothetical protein